MAKWKKIEGWPYEVSDAGTIRRIGGPELKQWRTKAGRWQVRMHDAGKTKQVNVYREVAKAFLGPAPFPGAVVAHKDDNLDRNDLKNLKWCTQKENCDDRTRNGRAATGSKNGSKTHPERVPRGERQGNAVLTEKDVLEIRSDPRSSRVVAPIYGVSATTIKDVRSRKNWSHVA